jgi:hypothetical protein
VINVELRRLAADSRLSSAENDRLSLAFGLACVERVSHLFELPEAHELMRELAQAVDEDTPSRMLAQRAERAATLARSHPGSTSIDGSGHSAVTATHALARALAVRPVDAAEYAAYALVYSYGRYAVQDPGSFATEFEWQVACLHKLLHDHTLAAGLARTTLNR